MKGPNRRIIIATLICIGLALVGIFSLIPVSMLEIEVVEKGQVFLIPIALGANFEIRYIHSVDHAPVKESFEIMPNGHLLLKEIAFQTHGAGIPAFAPGGVVFDGKWVKYPNFNREMENLRIRLGTVEAIAHQMHVAGKIIPLIRVGGAGNALIISVGKHPKIVIPWRSLSYE